MKYEIIAYIFNEHYSEMMDMQINQTHRSGTPVAGRP